MSSKLSFIELFSLENMYVCIVLKDMNSSKYNYILYHMTLRLGMILRHVLKLIKPLLVYILRNVKE